VTMCIQRALASTGKIALSWRNDSGSWSTPIIRSLGGDALSQIDFYSLGTYRSRQWRIEMTDAADFVLASAVEEFSVEGN